MNGNETIISKDFPKNVIEQAVAATRIRTSAYVSRRLDLRGKTVFAFAEREDCPSGTAFSLYRSDDGWQLGVHIADVCEYVCAGSPLDVEARRRCAAFGDKETRVEMLPDVLVYDLCDLTGNSDKLSLSVLLDIGFDGALKSVKFEESVICGAEKCIYSELEHIENTEDSSAIMLLRGKYRPYLDILLDMYELAAVLHNVRLGRGAADLIYFKKVYEYDEAGKVVSFRRDVEPDTRAMVREIGFYVSAAVGEFMVKHNLPSIFIGQKAIPAHILDYFAALLEHDCSETDLAKRTAHIAELAKGSEQYSFISEMLYAALPCAEFSDAPIDNALCCSDKITSFFRPTTRYTDLLTLRTIKEMIAASGNAKNLNLNRHRKIVFDAAKEASKAEEYVYNAHARYKRRKALEYIENNESTALVGFPLFRYDNGSVFVILDCGVRAIVTSEDAKDFKFKPAKPMNFEIIALGTEDEATVVKPALQ